MRIFFALSADALHLRPMPDPVIRVHSTEHWMPSYNELMDQAQKLMAQAEAQREKELQAVIDGVIQTLTEHGVTLDDLRAHGFGGRSGRRGKRGARNAGVPKYQDPKTGATWTGRGRVPGWMAAYDAAGKSRDRYLIK